MKKSIWGSNYRLQNNITERYLMQIGNPVKGWEGGWHYSPAIAEVGSELNFYNRGSWYISGAGTDYLK